MGAQLKIDGDETYALAAELAGLRGASIETVVNRALREALERDRRASADDAQEQDAEDFIAEIRAITADIRSHLKHPLPSSDHNYLYDYLYDDEIGLPR